MLFPGSSSFLFFFLVRNEYPSMHPFTFIPLGHAFHFFRLSLFILSLQEVMIIPLLIVMGHRARQSGRRLCFYVVKLARQ